MSQNWWTKASTSLTSNTKFCPSYLSYPSLVISPPIGDDAMVGVCVRKTPSQWQWCNNTGRDRVLWINSGLSKSSEHWEPLSVTDSAADAWGLSGIVPDDAERLWSSTWNKIVLPINFLSYLVFPPAVSAPCSLATCPFSFSAWEGAFPCCCPACCAAHGTLVFASGC